MMTPEAAQQLILVGLVTAGLLVLALVWLLEGEGDIAVLGEDEERGRGEDGY